MEIKVYKNNNFWVNSDHDFITLNYFETIKNQFETLFNAKVDFVNFDVIKVLVNEVDFTTLFVHYNNMNLYYYFDYIDKIVNNGVIAIFRLDVKLTYLIPFLKNWKDSNIALLITRNNIYSLNSLLYEDPLLKEVKLNFSRYQTKTLNKKEHNNINSAGIYNERLGYFNRLNVYEIKNSNTRKLTGDVLLNNSTHQTRTLNSLNDLNNSIKRVVIADNITNNSNAWVGVSFGFEKLLHNGFSGTYAVFNFDFYNWELKDPVPNFGDSVRFNNYQVLSFDENTDNKDNKLTLMVALPLFFSDACFSDEYPLINTYKGIQYLINNFKSKFIGIYKGLGLSNNKKYYKAKVFINNKENKFIEMLFINIENPLKDTTPPFTTVRLTKEDLNLNLNHFGLINENTLDSNIINLPKDYRSSNILWANYLPCWFNKNRIKLGDLLICNNFRYFFNNGFYLSYSTKLKTGYETNIISLGNQLPSNSDVYQEWFKNISISKNANNTRAIASGFSAILSSLPFGFTGGFIGANNALNIGLNNYVYNENLKATGATIQDEYKTGDILDIVNVFETPATIINITYPALNGDTIKQLNNVLYYFGNINPLYLSYEDYFNIDRPFHFATFDPVNLDLYINKLKPLNMPLRYLDQIKNMLTNGIRLWNQNIEI